MQENERRVLVVEDHPDIGLLYERLLPGCVVIRVTSGALACQALKAERYDLMILDMHLGEMSGLDVLRFVRQECADVKTPVLAISADDGMRQEARSIGIAHWLSKPIDIDEFYHYVNILKI